MPTWLPGMPGISKAGMARRVGDLDLDLLVVELAGAELLAERIAGGERGIGADQRIDHALLGVELGLGLHLLALGVAHETRAQLRPGRG